MDGVARNIMKPPTLSASSHDSFNHPFGEAIIYVQRDPTDEVDDDEDDDGDGGMAWGKLLRLANGEEAFNEPFIWRGGWEMMSECHVLYSSCCCCRLALGRIYSGLLN